MSEQLKSDPFAMSAGAPAIQGEMRPKPKFADRISKKIIMVAVVLMVIVMGLFFVAFDAIDSKAKTKPIKELDAAKKKADEENRGVPDELKDPQPVNGKPISPSLAMSVSTPEPTLQPEFIVAKPPAASASKPENNSPFEGDRPGGRVPAMGGEGNQGGNQPIAQLTPEEVAKKAAENKRLARMQEARSAGLSMKAFGSGATEAPGSATTKALSGLLAAAQQAQGAAGMTPVAMQQNKGDSEQDEKLDFLKNASKDDRGYHPHVPQDAISKNEIKFGTYLPMVLEQGMNSDQPGMITARITEDVYDTITGCRLLIPAMSKAIGKYDSKVAVGQNRALVVWNGMFFRDGSELNLGAMQGYDTSGAAGMESEVDNHYLRLFGLTFGMSMVTAGVTLSVPDSSSTSTNTSTQTPQQVVATALAQQYGQLGAQILGKYMAVQPTLKNYPGERFTIMVPRTMVFKKVWKNRCGV